MGTAAVVMDDDTYLFFLALNDGDLNRGKLVYSVFRFVRLGDGACLV